MPEALDDHDRCDAVARRATKATSLEWNISDTNRFTLKAIPIPVGTRASTLVLQDAWQGGHECCGRLTPHGTEVAGAGMAVIVAG